MQYIGFQFVTVPSEPAVDCQTYALLCLSLFTKCVCVRLLLHDQCKIRNCHHSDFAKCACNRSKELGDTEFAIAFIDCCYGGVQAPWMGWLRPVDRAECVGG